MRIQETRFGGRLVSYTAAGIQQHGVTVSYVVDGEHYTATCRVPAGADPAAYAHHQTVAVFQSSLRPVWATLRCGGALSPGEWGMVIAVLMFCVGGRGAGLGHRAPSGSGLISRRAQSARRAPPYPLARTESPQAARPVSLLGAGARR